MSAAKAHRRQAGGWHSTGQRSSQWRLLASGAVIASTVVLTACTSVTVKYPDGSRATQSRTQFAAYVETVFRYHNRVLNDFIFATSLGEGADLPGAGVLSQAEERMDRVCRPLNETVAASIEGRELDWMHKLKLPEAVPACEVATREVEKLLPAR